MCLPSDNEADRFHRHEPRPDRQILPGANIMDFASVGAYSVVYKKIDKGIYYCNHNKVIKKKRNLPEMQKKFIQLKNLLNK